MTPISPYPIWVGHGGEAHDFARIMDNGIEAVVDLAAEEPSRASPRDLVVCRFPLTDGTGNRPEVMSVAIRTLAGLFAAGLPTLVCCGAGLSRAPAFVAAAISVVEGEPPEDCLERVTRHHPSDVSPGLWGEVVGVVRSLKACGTGTP